MFKYMHAPQYLPAFKTNVYTFTITQKIIPIPKQAFSELLRVFLFCSSLFHKNNVKNTTEPGMCTLNVEPKVSHRAENCIKIQIYFAVYSSKKISKWSA